DDEQLNCQSLGGGGTAGSSFSHGRGRNRGECLSRANAAQHDASSGRLGGWLVRFHLRANEIQYSQGGDCQNHGGGDQQGFHSLAHSFSCGSVGLRQRVDAAERKRATPLGRKVAIRLGGRK